jgi:CBS domain-containing protein
MSHVCDFLSEEVMSKPIRDLMTRTPHTVGHDISVNKAVAMMREHSCHHLPVLDAGKLVGIVSDRDVRMIEKVSSGDSLKVEDIMTDEPVVVTPDQDVFQVAMLMHQKNIGSVIVSAQDGEPWGIFTATDALQYFTQK